MKSIVTTLSSALVATFIAQSAVRGQDSAQQGEPIVTSIDPTTLKYDILVDGSLTQDDPAHHRFKALQAAYDAAAEGTEARPTVIGIMPDVYRLPGGEKGASLNVTKNYLTLLGLTNNRRSVVLADDRGHSQGATDNGYLLNVNATGFTLRNLTLLNHCNVDYEYPGDASKNLRKRSDVITQAVALQAAGDKHVYDNVALLSRLDTMFLRTQRSYFRNVYIEGTDDFIGGGQLSAWEDCTIVFPTGGGVMSASNIAFIHCRFEATRGLQFYKAEFGSGRGRPVALIDCTLPVNSPNAPVAWVRGNAAPRQEMPSLTYLNQDAAGNAATIYDSTRDTTGFANGRELSEIEAGAFNPWNLLRASPEGTVDDWDPADARTTLAAMGSAIYRVTLEGTPASIRTGGTGVTLNAKVLPTRATDKSIKWSTTSDMISLDTQPDGSVLVTGRNDGENPAYAPVLATAANGFCATAYVLVEPTYIDPPTLTIPPTIQQPADGAVGVSYELKLDGRADQSLITWSLCDDVAGTNARVFAVSRGNEPLKSCPLPAGAIGKFLKVDIQPKHQRSDPGKAVSAISKVPIALADVNLRHITPRFQNFVVTPSEEYISGLWTPLGTWTIESGDAFENGYGIRVGSVGATLMYANDEPVGDMQIDLTMTPEKTAGMGFGSAGSAADGERVQRSDIYIKYNPRTKIGYALRFWRTTQSAEKCMYQLFKIEKGVGTPLNDQQVLSGVFKPTTHMTLKIAGDTLTVTASNDVDGEMLALQGKITPNPFGGAGVFWGGSVPRGNSNVYSRFEITYPPTAHKD